MNFLWPGVPLADTNYHHPANPSPISHTEPLTPPGQSARNTAIVRTDNFTWLDTIQLLHRPVMEAELEKSRRGAERSFVSLRLSSIRLAPSLTRRLIHIDSILDTPFLTIHQARPILVRFPPPPPPHGCHLLSDSMQAV